MASDSPHQQYRCPECGGLMEFDSFWSTQFQTLLSLWSCPGCRDVEPPDDQAPAYIKGYCEGEGKEDGNLLPVLIATDGFLS